MVLECKQSTSALTTIAWKCLNPYFNGIGKQHEPAVYKVTCNRMRIEHQRAVGTRSTTTRLNPCSKGMMIEQNNWTVDSRTDES